MFVAIALAKLCSLLPKVESTAKRIDKRIILKALESNAAKLILE
jgi:hypothetical protein